MERSTRTAQRVPLGRHGARSLAAQVPLPAQTRTLRALPVPSPHSRLLPVGMQFRPWCRPSSPEGYLTSQKILMMMMMVQSCQTRVGGRHVVLRGHHEVLIGHGRI